MKLEIDLLDQALTQRKIFEVRKVRDGVEMTKMRLERLFLVVRTDELPSIP